MRRSRSSSRRLRWIPSTRWRERASRPRVHGSASGTRTPPKRVNWGKRADRRGPAGARGGRSLADAHLAIANAAGTVYGGFDGTSCWIGAPQPWPWTLPSISRACRTDARLLPSRPVRRSRARGGCGCTAESGTQCRARLGSSRDPVVRWALHRSGRAGDGSPPGADRRPGRAALSGARPLLRRRRGGRADAGDCGAWRIRVRSQASLASIEAATGLRDQARARAAAVVSGPDLDHHVAYSLGAAFASSASRGEHDMAPAGSRHRLSLLSVVRAQTTLLDPIVRPRAFNVCLNGPPGARRNGRQVTRRGSWLAPGGNST